MMTSTTAGQDMKDVNEGYLVGELKEYNMNDMKSVDMDGDMQDNIKSMNVDKFHGDLKDNVTNINVDAEHKDLKDNITNTNVDTVHKDLKDNVTNTNVDTVHGDLKDNTKDINVDEVLGELRNILRQKYTEITEDGDTSSMSFGAEDGDSSSSSSSTPKQSPTHSAASISTISETSSLEQTDMERYNDSAGNVLSADVGNSDELVKVENKDVLGNTGNTSKEISDNKDSKPREVLSKLDLSVCSSNNQARSPTSPQSQTLSPVLAQPIIFKTSIKKDPGSKLQDQLVQELNTVLKKRNNVDRTPSVKTDNKDVHLVGNFDKNRKGGKPMKRAFSNTALTANLENHLSQTLKNRMEKQRQSLQENESSTIQKTPETLSFENHLSQMLKKRLEKQQDLPPFEKEKQPTFDSSVSYSLKTRLEKQRLSIQEYEKSVAQQRKSPPSEFASSSSSSRSVFSPIYSSASDHSEHFDKTDLKNKSGAERMSPVLKTENTEKRIRQSSSSASSSKSDTSVSDKTNSKHESITNSNNDCERKVTIYNVRPTDGVLYSVHVKSSSSNEGDTAGNHVTYINITGCPFIQNIDDGGLPTAEGDGLFRGEENRLATFYVDVGNRRGELGVQVDGPNSIAKTTVEPSGDRYICTYTPVEVGVFTLQLQWNGKNIPGSPFYPKIVDPSKVKLYGGWQALRDAQERVKLVVGEEKKLAFDVSQAGPGLIRAEVQGPSSSLPVTVDSHIVGQNIIGFIPEEEGNHYIHLFWADCTLPNSPFLGFAVRSSPDANKVILTGRGLKEAKVREEAEFIIDGSQAGAGAPEVTLSGVRAEISNRVVPLGNGRFHCTYTPVIPGAYLLHITWNGRQLKGSPYKVNVIGAFFPHKVMVSGEGLKGGVVGKTLDVLIDVRKAGPGELTASCMGPTRVAHVELHDNRDGTFQLSIKPVEVGRHVLQVKYGGEHVLASPFMLKVVSQPDASKVRVTGPGVEHGILATFQSSFVVETRGAGAGQLTVRIRGPKGGFQVEMYRDSQRDRTILCRYDPTETGLYIISIRWSGVDVPGSPFQINIVDTQQELEHHLQEQSAFSNSTATPRTYAQWKAEI